MYLYLFAFATSISNIVTGTAPHVESFNYFLETGLAAGVTDIPIYEVDMLDGSVPENRKLGHVSGVSSDTIKIWVENVKIAKPTKNQPSGISGGRGTKSTNLLPRECRELGIMYGAPLMADICVQIVRRDGYGHETPSGSIIRINRNFGNMPIMVMSKACNLHGKSPSDLIKVKEEQTEFGGYFIVSGIERCVRLLQVPRSNHATCIQRSNYKNRGKLYTDLGVAVRCQRKNGDMSTVTNTLHYLTTGGATLKFVARKQEFLLPLILVIRALSGCEDLQRGKEIGHGITDEELYHRIVQGDEDNTFVRARAELLLQGARAEFNGMQTPEECLALIGNRFRITSSKPNSTSDVEIGNYIIDRYVFFFGVMFMCSYGLALPTYSHTHTLSPNPNYFHNTGMYSFTFQTMVTN